MAMFDISGIKSNEISAVSFVLEVDQKKFALINIYFDDFFF